ncbi:MAG: aspartate aminotransferase family protein, partial [Bacillota bacterium]
KHGCLDRNLLVTAIGTTIIRTIPPLIATKEDCDSAMEILKASVEEAAGKL